MSKEFKHESLESCKSVVEHLQAISEGFEKGQLLFGNKFEQFVLEPSDNLKMKIKVKRKDGKVKVSVKFLWDEKNKVKKDKKHFELVGASASQ